MCKFASKSKLFLGLLNYHLVNVRHTMTVKDIILSVLTALLVSFITSSCVKRTERGDTFEAEFYLTSDVVYDGEEFGFTIQTNREQLKIKSFLCPIAPNLVKENSSVQVTDGIYTVKKKVSINSSQRGKLSVTVEDPITGGTMDFSAIYTAYAATGLSMSIDNEINATSKNPKLLPIIANGDDFRFTVFSKTETLIVKDFQSDFGNDIYISSSGQKLRKGQELKIVEGEENFVMYKVNAYDKYAGNEFAVNDLRMTFNNPETNKDTTLIASYVMMDNFKPIITLVDKQIRNGQKAQIRINCNRRYIYIKSVDFPDWFVMDDSVDGETIDLGQTYTKIFNTEELVVENAVGGTLYFEVVDYEYTGRTLTVPLDYTIAQNVDPENVNVSTESCYISEDEIIPISVSTTTLYSNNLFHVSMARNNDKGKIKFYAPKKNESHEIEDIQLKEFADECDVEDGQFFMKGGSEGGEYVVTVSAKNKKDVKADIKVTVRFNAAFVVDGTFSYLVGHYSARKDMPDFGWLGLPMLLKGYFATYSRDPANYIDVESISDRKILVNSLTPIKAYDYSVTTALQVPSKRTTGFFAGAYGEYKGKSGANKDDPHEPGNTTSTYPEGNTYVEILEPSSKIGSSGEIILEQTRQTLEDWDCWCIHYLWQYKDAFGYTTTYDWAQERTPKVTWDYLDFKVLNITDVPNINVKYIIYAFKANEPKRGQESGMHDINTISVVDEKKSVGYQAAYGWNCYWWRSIDRLPWIEKYEKK